LLFFFLSSNESYSIYIHVTFLRLTSKGKQGRMRMSARGLYYLLFFVSIGVIVMTWVRFEQSAWLLVVLGIVAILYSIAHRERKVAWLLGIVGFGTLLLFIVQNEANVAGQISATAMACIALALGTVIIGTSANPASNPTTTTPTTSSTARLEIARNLIESLHKDSRFSDVTFVDSKSFADVMQSVDARDVNELMLWLEQSRPNYFGANSRVYVWGKEIVFKRSMTNDIESALKVSQLVRRSLSPFFALTFGIGRSRESRFPWLQIMEYRGIPLGNLSVYTFNEAEKHSVMTQIALAIGAMCSVAGIYHRDLNKANVLAREVDPDKTLLFRHSGQGTETFYEIPLHRMEITIIDFDNSVFESSPETAMMDVKTITTSLTSLGYSLNRSSFSLPFREFLFGLLERYKVSSGSSSTFAFPVLYPV
jgi:hypothetical protein